MSLSICWLESPGKLKCRFLPIPIPPWMLDDPWRPGGRWNPGRSWPARIGGRIRDAISELAGRLPPNPWRGVDLRLAAGARRDLSLLATIDTLAQALSPDLRGTVQGSVHELSGRVPLPPGAQVRMGTG